MLTYLSGIFHKLKNNPLALLLKEML